MNGSSSNRCGYRWPDGHDIDDYPDKQSCCWRETVSEEHDRCVWHVDSDEVTKSAQKFRAVRELPEVREQTSTCAELLDGANLSGVEWGYQTSFADVALRDSDLSGADLRGADLSGADLRGADLTGADLRKATIKDVSVDGRTACSRLFERESSDTSSREWDSVARAYHDLKRVFIDNGLVGKARKMHVRERRARTFEAKAAGGRFTWRYLGSLFSRTVTGYGVEIQNLVVWMAALFLVSTAVYVSVGVEDTLVENVSYSVLTFTVAPPKIPTAAPFAAGTQLVMMIETFFGTISIVVLGYILGNRERL